MSSVKSTRLEYQTKNSFLPKIVSSKQAKRPEITSWLIAPPTTTDTHRSTKTTTTTKKTPLKIKIFSFSLLSSINQSNKCGFHNKNPISSNYEIMVCCCGSLSFSYGLSDE